MDHRWIQTFTGRQFWPLTPRVEDVDIRDIAHALALKCRYTGHCDPFYSVAQHSVMAMWLMHEYDTTVQQWTLMHDAAEAYLPDVSKPIKDSLPGFNEMEDRVLACVAGRFNLPWPLSDALYSAVKVADMTMLATEYRDVTPVKREPWIALKGWTPSGSKITAWSPEQAEMVFLKEFQLLFPNAA